MQSQPQAIDNHEGRPEDAHGPEGNLAHSEAGVDARSGPPEACSAVKLYEETGHFLAVGSRGDAVVTLNEPRLVLPAAEVGRLERILDDGPGPTNLDRTRYQSVRGPDGTRLYWRGSWQAPWEKWLKGLTDEGGLTGPNYIRMGLRCYAAAIGEDRLVIWRQVRMLPPGNVLRMSLFDTTSLSPMSYLTRARPGDSVFHKSAPLAEVDLPGNWEGGARPFSFPKSMHLLPELLLFVRTFPGSGPGVPRKVLEGLRLPAIYVPKPPQAKVEVLPLEWARAFEGNWHWIARLARDARTGNIVGDGPGMRLFLLDERARFLGWIYRLEKGGKVRRAQHWWN